MSLDHWHIPTSEEEIVDVFVEEVGELLENVDDQMSAWKKNPGDNNALTEIRRTFHTLKSSGRMVKALDLSELSWKVESMLNQAISGIVPATDDMVDLVAAVCVQIPKMVHAFKHGHSVAGNSEIADLTKLAENLAAGRKPNHTVASPASTVSSGMQNLKLNELNLKYERCMQRADEALHRSELALQRARRGTTGCAAQQSGSKNQGACAELDRIGERVSLLTQELSEGLLESKISQRESFLDQSELNPLIEKRLRAKMAPLELLHIELERDIEANRLAMGRLRRLGWLTLVPSALFGGAIAIGLHMWILSAG